MASKKQPAKPKKSTPKKQSAKKRIPQLWDLVTREGKDGTYTITAMSPDCLTCTLTLMKGSMFTNLEHYRVLVSTLMCMRK